MDSGTPRVEIELDAQEPKRSRRRAAHRVERSVLLDAPPAAAHDVEEAVPTRGAPRNQLVITGLAVGLVALFLGWVLGRAGGADDAATAAPATSATPATTAATVAQSTDAATDDTLPEAQLPTTTRPRPTTTTTLAPAWVESTVEIDPRLAGQADRIVAFTEDQHVVEVEVATGVVRSLGFSGPSGGSPPVAGDDWVIMPANDGSVRIFTDGSPRPINAPIDDGSSIFWQYGTDRFWRPEFDAALRGARVYEIGTDGRRTGRELDTHGFWPSASDPAGGLIVGDEQIGVFIVDVAGSRRLPGRVIAISADHVLTYSCGDTLGSCGLQVLDRASGEVTAVPAPPAGDATDPQRYGDWWSTGSPAPTISADGRAAVVPVPTETSMGIAVLDLATGTGTLFEMTPSASMFSVPSGGFSADGRFAYVSDLGTLTAFDLATGDSFAVAAEGIPDIATLAVRPPVPAT